MSELHSVAKFVPLLQVTSFLVVPCTWHFLNYPALRYELGGWPMVEVASGGHSQTGFLRFDLDVCLCTLVSVELWYQHEIHGVTPSL